MDDMERLINTMKIDRDNENLKKQKLEYQLTIAAKEAQTLADKAAVAKLEADKRIAELSAQVEDLIVNNSALEERLELITEEARKKIENLNGQISNLSAISNPNQSQLLLQYQQDFDTLKRNLQDARDDLNESAERLERSTKEKIMLQQKIQELSYQLDETMENTHIDQNNDNKELCEHYENVINELNQTIASQDTNFKSLKWRVSRMTDGIEDELQQVINVLNGSASKVNIKWIVEGEEYSNIRKLLNILYEKVTKGNITVIQPKPSFDSPLNSPSRTKTNSLPHSPLSTTKKIDTSGISYSTPSRNDKQMFINTKYII